MITLDLLGVAVAMTVAAAAPSDTIVGLERGDRVVLENISGEISVRTWGRDELEVRGEDEETPLERRLEGLGRSCTAVARDRLALLRSERVIFSISAVEPGPPAAINASPSGISAGKE